MGFNPLLRYLVYNLRKRGGDSADKYFKSTELIAGVKDMRFQALMPDVLHWLGIKKIDNMVSMSDMYVFAIPTFLICIRLTAFCGYRKYDAIVNSGIPIIKRYDIPGLWNTMFNLRACIKQKLSRTPHSSGFPR